MPQCNQGILFLPGTGLFCSHDLQIGNEDYVLGRVDYTLGPKDSLFARYIRESAYQVLPYVYTPVPGYPEIDNERNQYLTIEERHTFSPRMLNEVRFGFVRLFTLTANGGAQRTPSAIGSRPAGYGLFSRPESVLSGSLAFESKPAGHQPVQRWRRCHHVDGRA